MTGMGRGALTSYQIIDEPRPGLLSRLAVNPLWPLLGFILGGVFFSWIWAVFNSFALGSPTRVRESVVVILGAVGYFALFFLMLILVNSGLVEGLSHHYTRILLVAVALLPSYYLFQRQSTAFELYEYFGGKTINALPLLILGFGYLAGGKLQVAVINTVMNGVAQWIH